MMREWTAEARKIYLNKIYLLMLCLTAACGYGFKIAHPAMGIDDTPYVYYFEEGLAAIVGRWVLFLLNKVIHISDFAPFLTDFAAVLVLMAAVTVWSVLFYSILKEKVPAWGYRFFACIFLSCPLISEVFTYYLHNGIAIGYLCSGLSLCLFREGLLLLEEKGRRKQALLSLLGALCLMVTAMGCYESFMVVWLSGALLMFLAERLAGVRRNALKSLFAAAVMAVCGMLLRSMVISIVIAVFRLDDLRDEAVLRSMGEMLGWMFEPGASAEFAMVLKRIFVMYGVFAYAYYPIRIFVFASAVIGLFCLWRCIRQKDIWIALLTAGSFVAAFLLIVIEGKATLYRSAQFLPLFCGYGILLLACALRRSRVLFPLLGAVILWNQCADLNQWFYVDYKKYEYAKELTGRIYYELEQNFDTGKPVIFTGEWENPKSLVADAYVDYGTEKFFQIKRITDLVDEHLLEKFYRDYGVWVAQTPSLSVVNWGRYAFGTDEELVRFMAHHGHEILPLLEEDWYAEAEEYSRDLPRFPETGSVVDRGNYIIVHL